VGALNTPGARFHVTSGPEAFRVERFGGEEAFTRAILDELRSDDLLFDIGASDSSRSTPPCAVRASSASNPIPLSALDSSKMPTSTRSASNTSSIGPSPIAPAKLGSLPTA
jgi:hypothetical protein